MDLRFQKVCELLENPLKDSRLYSLSKDFNGGGIVVAINLAAHQSFNFFFVEQSQSVSSFHEWTGVDFVV